MPERHPAPESMNEVEPVDLSNTSVGDFIAECDDHAAIAYGPSQLSFTETGFGLEHSRRLHDWLLRNMTAGLEPLAGSHPQRGYDYLQVLSAHPNLRYRVMAYELILPLLAHELAWSEPQPEPIIDIFATLAGDPEPDVRREAPSLVAELLAEPHLAKNLTVAKLKPVLDMVLYDHLQETE